MNRQFDPYRVAQWCTWAAGGLAALAALVAVVATAAGPNRDLWVAIPFAIAAGALAAAELQRAAWISGLLYAAGVLALLYGIVATLSLPLRLAIEGSCPLSLASCPVGFEHPASAAEMFVVYAASISAALAIVLALVAVEARFRHGPRRMQEQSTPPRP